MFRNNYDGDVTTWSPNGRIFQVEYAMEAVKQGSATVAVRSDAYAVLASLKRSQSDLASFQKKIFKIDDHCGVAISGLTVDGRMLCKFLRNECLDHKYSYNSAVQVGRLALRIADKSQVRTQRSGRRPYGVGLLMIGYDKTGPHVLETCPSANYYEYYAQAIGQRSQSARTYLEKNLGEFAEADKTALIRHALLALNETLQDNEQLTAANLSLAVVGKDEAFQLFEDDAVAPYLQLIADAVGSAAAPAAAADGDGDGGDGNGDGDGDVAMAH